MEIEHVKPIIDSIVEINQLMKKHAEERLTLLSELFENFDKLIKSNERNISLVEDTLTQVHELHENVKGISVHNVDDKYLEQMKLKSVNTLISDLDKLDIKKNELENHLEQLNVSIEGRNELINILDEYVELENASNYKMVAEIAELDNIKYNFVKSMEMYSLLSRYDPRIQALTIMEKYPQGITRHQLIKMLDISPYEARRIINELVSLNLITSSGNNNILHIPGNKVNLGLLQTL